MLVFVRSFEIRGRLCDRVGDCCACWVSSGSVDVTRSSSERALKAPWPPISSLQISKLQDDRLITGTSSSSAIDILEEYCG